MDKKISQLTAATTPLVGNELLPIVQGGVTKSVTALDLSGGVIDVTLSEALSLIGSSSLQKGATYKISGVYKNKTSDYPLAEVLYDDGTNSGTTVYLVAISSNEFAKSGWGEFYNPNYYDGNSYDNTDGTGLYGIWDGDNPNAGDIPTYSINEVVFWGGYAWRNLTGNVGTADSVVALDSTNWVKLPYSSSAHYNKVIDYVEVDLEIDYISRRKNIENDIDVFADSNFYQYWVSTGYHPISVMGWGLYSKIDEGIDSWEYGMVDISVQDAYFQTVNFKGVALADIHLSYGCKVENNYFGIYSAWRYFRLTDFSYIKNIIAVNSEWTDLDLSMYSRIEYITANNAGRLNKINLNDNSYISNIDFRNSTNCALRNLDLNTNSYITYITFSNTLGADNRFNDCKLDNSSSIYSITIDTGDSVYITENVLTSGGSINQITISSGSFTASFNRIDIGTIQSITASGSSFNMTYNKLNGGTLSTYTVTNVAATIDVSSNVLYSSFLGDVTVSGGSCAVSGNFLSNSQIGSLTLSQSTFFNNYVYSCQNISFALSGTISNKQISKVTFNGVAPFYDYNVSTASIIFGDYPKEVFARQDGTTKLKYCNNSDVIVVVNPTA